MKYYVDFGTGVGNEEFKTLEKAKEFAEKAACYTQQDIDIKSDGEIITTLPWYGYEPEENEQIKIQFGKFGFYSNWTDESSQNA